LEAISPRPIPIWIQAVPVASAKGWLFHKLMLEYIRGCSHVGAPAMVGFTTSLAKPRGMLG
jgi:hypothetical protein